MAEIDTSIPSSARVYDYLLGGTDNFEADRQAARRQAAAFGGVEAAQASVRANRRFLGRVVRYLTGVAGVRQFLDIGSGIPTMDNVHEVAQQVAADSRIVYVDKDPVVLAHADELLRGSPEGVTDFLIGDLYDPTDILRRATETIDLARPVAVVLNAVLHHVPEDRDASRVVNELLEPLCSGSYLAISHLASDIEPERMAALADAVPPEAAYSIVPRDHTQVARLLNGLDLLPPGVVPIDQWMPDESPGPTPAYHYGAVGRKP